MRVNVRALLTRPVTAVDTFFLAPVDARIYALTRICFALFALALVIELWPMRATLFSIDGVMPERHDLHFYMPLAHVRSQAGVSALLVVTGLAAVSLAFGLFSRAMLFYLYSWSVGYSATAYAAEAGYDAIGRIGALVLFFSPGLRAWSIDARIFGPGPAEVPRYALRLLQWQLVLIYVITVWLKAPDSYWRNGELMAYFLMSMYSRVADPIWAELGRTSVLLTWGGLLMETLIPILLCGRYRRWGFLLGFMLHAGIGFSSTIGMFSLAMVPLYASFVQREDLVLLRLARDEAS